MKRQRGRNRGGGGGGGGGNQKPTQNANRAFDSNGPDNVKVRGNAQHVFEKYQQLARDASSGGDRVLAENYLQHAEHYFRLIRALQPTRAASEIIGRDQFASGYDIDFEDEALQAISEAADEAALEAGPPAEARQDGGGEQNRDQFRDRDQNRDRNRDRGGEWQNRDGQNRDGGRNRDRGEWQSRDGQNRDRNRDRDRPRDDRPRDDRPRDDRPRDERPRDDRPREDRPRDDRPRDDRPRDDRPRGEDGERRERYDRQDRGDRDRDRDPLAVVQPQGEPARDEGPVLRDAEGGESQIPSFLRPTRPIPVAAAVEASEEPPKKAPRRRKPRSFEGGEGGASSETEDA